MLLLGLVWDCSRKFFPCDRLVKRSVSRRNVREHAERQFGIAWRGRGDGYDPKALAERPQGNAFGGGALVRRSVSRPRRTRHGGACSVVGLAPKRSGGSVVLGAGAVSAARAPPGWAPAALGPDIRRGSTPLRTDPSRPIDHFEVRGAIAVVVFDVILEPRDRHIVVPTVQQGLPLLLRSVVHDDEPVREGLHRRIAVPLG